MAFDPRPQEGAGPSPQSHPTQPHPTQPHPTRLDHFPISFFGVTMGLFGLTLAALTSASFRFAALTGSAAHRRLGLILLVVLCGTILALLWRTVPAARAGRICVPKD